MELQCLPSFGLVFDGCLVGTSGGAFKLRIPEGDLFPSFSLPLFGLPAIIVIVNKRRGVKILFLSIVYYLLSTANSR